MNVICKWHRRLVALKLCFLHLIIIFQETYPHMWLLQKEFIQSLIFLLSFFITLPLNVHLCQMLKYTANLGP